MKVNDPNLQAPVPGQAGIQSTSVGRAAEAGRGGAGRGVAPAGDASDGVALSGLAQSLRSLDVESPERQARVEALRRAYAQGAYSLDVDAVAGGVIEDALQHR